MVVDMQTFPFRPMVEKYGWKEEDLIFITNYLDSIGLKIYTLAGGSIRRSILGEDVIYNKSDFDLFFQSQEEYNNAISIFDTLNVEKRESSFASSYKLYFKDKYGESPIIVQCIKLIRQSIQELLDSFDFTICQFATRKENNTSIFDVLYCGDTSLYDLARKKLVVNTITFGHASLKRIIKYTKQGFYMCEGAITDFLRKVGAPDSMIRPDIKYID